MRHDAQLSIRLPRDLAEKLDETASARGMDRSDLVRDAIRLYLEGPDESDRPWDRVGDLAGAASGGPPDLARRQREYLKELLSGS
ncbi:MAG: ribbon-helix-helix domain-containing protein [Candidatus Palauibacterales bacterium]|nr:ribbon-helix-helix domain-containing protein [Candidatus Palauibacterales bacterium]